MNRGRLVLSTVLAALSALGLAAAASAAPSPPVWNLDIHHNETNFPPGGLAEYWVDLSNIGGTASSGQIRLTVQLPDGITRSLVRRNFNQDLYGGEFKWDCPGAPGDTSIECTTTGSVPRKAVYRGLVIAVAIGPDASGDKFASATVEGGGAASSSSTVELTHISPEWAEFGIPATSFTPDFLEADGVTPVREAGAHPSLFVIPFDFNSIPAATAGAVDQQKISAARIRNLVVDTPPGFIGNPTVVGECTQAQFTVGQCPPSSQVGRIDLRLYPISSLPTQTYTPYTTGVFNLTHPRGTVTDLGFAVLQNPVHIKVSLDPAKNYAIRSKVSEINETLAVYEQRLTLWGIPADPSHDFERCKTFSVQSVGEAGDTGSECTTDTPLKPFLSVPSECDAEHVMRLHHYDSWQNTGVFGPEIDYTQPGVTTACDKPRFEPDVEIEPTGKQANTPTGLDVHVKIAQNENANALATPPVKRFTVRLPQGMSFSPSFADGLNSCTLAQMQLGTNNPVQCPDASRIGEVELHTPLLPKSAVGSMYLAAQGDNPFGSTFALLLVLEDTEERGALIKIPGRIDVDETTGQITTVFNDTPQFPFDDLTLKFRSGPRAPLVSPPTCGKQTIGIEVASYAQPQNPVDASNTYEVTEGPNGTPCPPDSARRSFHPTFTGGTLNPVAGSYSPFLFRMTRTDDEQELSQVTTTLPQGLVAKIAGIPACPNQAINSISTALGAGRSEQSNPACPAASQIGTISAGLGAGPGPNYFGGKVYLAGPYKGAPLSLAIIAPGLAGPFDLGNVVVRAALYVDPNTTEVRAVSDPFPTILHGVILRVRDVRLRVDRPNTTINPTSCAKKAVGGLITGVGGSLQSTADDSLFSTSAPFQVGSCSDLAYAPKLDLRLFGGTHRGSHPKFKATARFPAGGSNTAFASVALPHSEFLDQGHIGTVCTRPQFQADACPKNSIYGTVSAKTPLLDEELHGNIYLRPGGNKLPDIVAAFRGGRIDANLVGRIDSVNRGIRNTFDFVPDVPVSSATFTFFGGSRGLLVNSRDICKNVPRATAKFTGQNGAKVTLHPPLKSACGKAKKKAKAKAKRAKNRHR